MKLVTAALLVAFSASIFAQVAPTVTKATHGSLLPFEVHDADGRLLGPMTGDEGRGIRIKVNGTTYAVGLVPAAQANGLPSPQFLDFGPAYLISTRYPCAAPFYAPSVEFGMPAAGTWVDPKGRLLLYPYAGESSSIAAGGYLLRDGSCQNAGGVPADGIVMLDPVDITGSFALPFHVE